MANDFDWQNEEDGDWRQQPATPAGITARRTWRRRPLLLLAFVLLASGALAYFGLARQTAAREAAVVQDVLRSHALVAEAARRADDELFRLLLSSRDLEWVEEQTALLAAGLLFERAPLGLTLAAAEGNVVAVTLSADLQEAVVSSDWPYSLEGPDGTTSTILRQTAVYRQGASGWLLAPPLPHFWGPTLSADGRYVRLSYPERDQLLARRLAADLDETIAHACRTLPQLTCYDLRLQIDLSASPAALVGLSQPEALLPAGLQLVLPAPTVAGLPLDEAGYQALYRGYAARAVAAVLNYELGWNCCRRALFYQALLDKQLAELGLRAWPLPNDAYRRALRHLARLGDVSELWHSDAAADPSLDQAGGWMAYALVDFVLQASPPASLADMQVHFLTMPILNVWLQRVSAGGSSRGASELEHDWAAFLQRRAVAALPPRPLPWPDEELLLLCASQWGRSASLYRYDPAGNSWSTAAAGRPFLLMNALPGSRGALLIESELTAEGDLEQVRTILWQDGREVVLAAELLFQFGPLQPDPAGQYLPLLSLPGKDQEFAMRLLDLDSCRPDGCRLLPIAGIPTWSPDGTQTLLDTLEVFFGGQAQLLQRAGRIGESPVRLPDGAQPFWLDDMTYGYNVQFSGATLMAARVADDQPFLLLEPAQLAALLPGDVDPELLSITDLALAPTGRLFLIVDLPSARPPVGRPGHTDRYLVSLDWPSRALALLGEWGGQDYFIGALSPLSFSPDGRWLLILQPRQFGAGSPPVVDLILYDIEGGQMEKLQTGAGQSGLPTSFAGWSSDGRWLAWLIDDGLVLTAPGYDYDHPVLHDFGECLGVAWVRRGGR
jgi:hypothetical protein